MTRSLIYLRDLLWDKARILGRRRVLWNVKSLSQRHATAIIIIIVTAAGPTAW